MCRFLPLIVTMTLVARSCQAFHFSPPMRTTTAALSLRGGNSDNISSTINPALVAAQVTTVTCLAKGMLRFFLPKVDAKIYGTPNIELPMVEIMTTGNGSCLLSIGLMGLMLFSGNNSGSDRRLNRALSISYLPFSASLLRNMWTGVAAKVQQPVRGMLFGLAINTCLSLAVLTEAKHALLAATIWSIFIEMNGLFFIANPKAAVQSWGVRGATTEVDLHLMQKYGFLLCYGHVIVLALIYGIAPTRAFGYGTLCACAMFLKLKPWSKDNRGPNLQKIPQIFWALGSLLTTAAMLVY